MPDDVSPDVDPRSVDDLITQMMERTGRPALPEQQPPNFDHEGKPTPEFLKRNPRIAASIQRQQANPPSPLPRLPLRQGPNPGQWGQQPTPGAVRIGPNGEIIIPP